MARSVKIAIIQQTAHFLELPASVDLGINLIKECAEKGAQLIVFGECWLTGYPAWIDHATDYTRWDDETTKAVFRKMYLNSIALASDEFSALLHATRDFSVCVCMGLNEIERSGTGTIFNSVVILDHGQLIFHHRKLIPTYTEKLLYGVGDGRGLAAVDSSVGRIGALICWEHWMPLTRQAMHDSGEEIHIALWPQVHEMLQVASRHYAFEGRSIVVAAGQVMHAGQMPSELHIAPDHGHLLLAGGSAIIGANGHYLLEPARPEHSIITYTIQDLDEIYGEKMTLDVSTHYHRPDIFQFRHSPVGG